MKFVTNKNIEWLCLDLNDTMPFFEQLAEGYAKEDTPLRDDIINAVYRVAVLRKDIEATNWRKLLKGYEALLGKEFRLSPNNHFMRLRSKRHGNLHSKAIQAFAEHELDLNRLLTKHGKELPQQPTESPTAAVNLAPIEARMQHMEKQLETIVELLGEMVEERSHLRVINGGKS